VKTVPCPAWWLRKVLCGKGFRAFGAPEDGTVSDDGFDRFFPFGLTWSATRFTVTVRNHPRRWTPRRSAPLGRLKVRPMTHAFRGGRGQRPLVPSRANVDDEKVSLGAATMPSEYAKALGARLRAIRTQQGLSLHGVEEKSRGRWKAVVVGSYERGDRAVTVQKLSELAEFYGVPVSELLPGGAAPSPLGPTPKLVIDLERLQQLPKDKAGPLARYAATIQSQRGDYNGKVLSIRQEDLRSLAVIYDKSPTELTEELIGWGVLDPEARRAVEAF
jgi:transcriptional regulator with XRE-family HTH domain